MTLPVTRTFVGGESWADVPLNTRTFSNRTPRDGRSCAMAAEARRLPATTMEARRSIIAVSLRLRSSVNVTRDADPERVPNGVGAGR